MDSTTVLNRQPAVLITEDEADTIVSAYAFTETPNALGVYGVGGKEVWLPLSQIEILDGERETPNGPLNRAVELSVPNWLVQRKKIV